MSAVFKVALAAGVVTAVLGLVSLVWRREDSRGWHLIWTVVAAASLCAGPIAIVAPMPQLVMMTTVWSPPTFAAGEVVPLIGAVYLFGVAVLLTRLLVAVVGVRRLASQAVDVSTDDRARLVTIVGSTADCCRLHPELVVPVVAAGRILLPSSWVEWSEMRLQAVLLHESAHLERRDAAWTLVAGLHKAVFWPSPAAWWVSRVIRRRAEQACDAAAAEVVGATTCARALVEGAKDINRDAIRLPQLALGAHDDLEARVDALLAISASPARLSRVALMSVIVVVLTALTAAAQHGGDSASAGGVDHTARHALRHARH